VGLARIRYCNLAADPVFEGQHLLITDAVMDRHIYETKRPEMGADQMKRK